MSSTEGSWRFQVCSAEQFDHLRNPCYFNVRFEPSFQREIVELKSVCWLKFTKKFGRHGPGNLNQPNLVDEAIDLFSRDSHAFV